MTGQVSQSAEVSVVIVAFGDQAFLESCVEACLASRGVTTEVIVVDNGCTDGAVERIRRASEARVVDAGGNIGFAAASQLGAALSQGDVVAFINPDAVPAATALMHLAHALRDPTVGIATASLRMMGHPAVLNAAGNDVHFLGLSWCRAFNEDAGHFTVDHDVMAASGAAMALRRNVLLDLGGFVPEYFAYYEDIEISLRAWQRGLRVVYVSSSVVLHDYEFSSSVEKFFLLDRNRLLTFFTILRVRTIILIAPALIAHEIALFGVSAIQGWFPQRVRSTADVIRHARWIVRRRRQLSRGPIAASDVQLVSKFAAVVDPSNLSLPRWAIGAQKPVGAYWRLVRRFIR